MFEKCSIIVDAINSMKLSQRERGRKDGVCKYNALLGRYFKRGIKTRDESKDSKKTHIIKQGTVIEIDDLIHSLFLVTVVWKCNGTK